MHVHNTLQVENVGLPAHDNYITSPMVGKEQLHAQYNHGISVSGYMLSCAKRLRHTLRELHTVTLLCMQAEG